MQKSKIITGIFLFIFFVAVTSVVAAGLVIKEKPSNFQSNTLPVISPDDITKHSTPSDCWILINNQLYDVTPYLNDHPGGRDKIIPFCGKDATTAFNTKGKNPASLHSQLAISLLAKYRITNSASPSATTPASVAISPTVTNIPPKTSNISLTVAEVAKHATSSDCWMILSGKVYDFTTYISSHPGGLAMTPFCGKDGTTGFQTQGGKGSHSAFASSLFGSYYLGDLGSSATPQTITAPLPRPNREDEFEDD